MQEKIIEWFANGEVGASSRVMASTVSGAKATDGSYPSDPADFNRCLLFLDAVPEARGELHKLKAVNSHWEKLIERWLEVEISFLAEVGRNWSKAKSVPKTHRLMKSIYKS